MCANNTETSIRLLRLFNHDLQWKTILRLGIDHAHSHMYKSEACLSNCIPYYNVKTFPSAIFPLFDLISFLSSLPLPSSFPSHLLSSSPHFLSSFLLSLPLLFPILLTSHVLSHLLTLSSCLRIFPIVLIKHPGKQFKGKRIYFSSQSRIQAIMAEKSTSLEPEAIGHIASLVRERSKQNRVLSISYSQDHTSHHHPGNSSTPIEMHLPISVNAMKTVPPRHTKG